MTGAPPDGPAGEAAAPGGLEGLTAEEIAILAEVLGVSLEQTKQRIADYVARRKARGANC